VKVAVGVRWAKTLSLPGRPLDPGCGRRERKEQHSLSMEIRRTGYSSLISFVSCFSTLETKSSVRLKQPDWNGRYLQSLLYGFICDVFTWVVISVVIQCFIQHLNYASSIWFYGKFGFFFLSVVRWVIFWRTKKFLFIIHVPFTETKKEKHIHTTLFWQAGSFI
jgi:hypothetical protein